jgi:hypothetical protein
MTKNALNLEITKSGTPKTYTFQNADGTLAFLTDITGTNSGTNTGDNAPNSLYKEVVHSSISAGVTTTAANTTPVDVSGAVFTYAANSVYRIWVMGRLNSTAATTGAAIHFNLSSAVTAINIIG